MKRLFTVLSLVMMLSFFITPVFAQATGEISVLVNGQPVSFDVKPVVQSGRTLVPFRPLAEALQVTVNWDSNTKTIRAEGAGNSLLLVIGNQLATRNENSISLDVPPQIIDGRTFIPLRFFSEAFACQVQWNPDNSLIVITSQASEPVEMEVLGYYALGDKETSSWTNLFSQPFPLAGPGNTNSISTLALGWYNLDQAGNLLTKSTTGWQRPDDYNKVLEAADTYKMSTQMIVHLTDGDNALTNLLTNQLAVEKAVSAIVEEAKLYNGVNLDFEGLGLSNTGDSLTQVRDNFTRFVQLLAAQLKAVNLDLTLSLHAPNSAYQGYDYGRLGELADTIVIMAYDYGSKPEPDVLVVQAVEGALAKVPANKLLLGISLPNETPASLQTKIEIAKKYHLKGIALWRLGLVSNDMWSTLHSSVSAQK